MNKALKTDYISIDERTLIDRLQLTLDYANEVKFHSREMQDIPGGWQSFFRRDSAFIIAEIAHTDLDKFKIQNASFDRENDEMLSFLKLMMEHLLDSNYKGSLTQEIKMIIKSIEDDMALIRSNDSDKQSLNKKIFGHLVFIKEKASKKFEEEILGTSDHFPQVGLLLTFLNCLVMCRTI